MHAVIDLEVDLEGGAGAMRELPPDRRSDLLFIAREALSNVARHSGATRTALVLAKDERDLILCVEDNGRGFDPATVPGPDAFGRHQGLGNMRDRAIGLGGTLPRLSARMVPARVSSCVYRSPPGPGFPSVLSPPPEIDDRD